MCYGAAANMILRIKVNAQCTTDPSVYNYEFSGPRYGIDVSGWPLFIMGGALMMQNVSSIWTLSYMFRVKKGALQSWSLDPVVNAIFMIVSGHDKRDTVASSELILRNSLHKQVPRARALIRVVWATFAFMVGVVGLTVYFASVTSAFSLESVRENGGDIWQFWGLVYTVVGDGSGTTDWAGMRTLPDADC